MEEENKKREEVFREEIPRPYSSFINELEEENRKLKDIEAELLKEKKELLDKVKQLEERLDNKEKVNKQLREEIKELNKMMLFETELEK